MSPLQDAHQGHATSARLPLLSVAGTSGAIAAAACGLRRTAATAASGRSRHAVAVHARAARRQPQRSACRYAVALTWRIFLHWLAAGRESMAAHWPRLRSPAPDARRCSRRTRRAWPWPPRRRLPLCLAGGSARGCDAQQRNWKERRCARGVSSSAAPLANLEKKQKICAPCRPATPLPQRRCSLASVPCDARLRAACGRPPRVGLYARIAPPAAGSVLQGRPSTTCHSRCCKIARCSSFRSSLSRPRHER